MPFLFPTPGYPSELLHLPTDGPLRHDDCPHVDTAFRRLLLPAQCDLVSEERQSLLPVGSREGHAVGGRSWRPQGRMLCHCLHVVGLLAAQLGLLLGLQRTPNSGPPEWRPVSYLPVATRPVHLSCVRNARCLEGFWRRREAVLLWILLFGSELLIKLGEKEKIRMSYSFT